MSNWKWYGVKTIYRLEPAGKPKATDRDYWAEGSLVEERVVVFRARSFAEATRKAEREAGNYAALTKDRNPYGQRLSWRYVGACDAFEIFDEAVVSGAEVFSTTEMVSRSVNDAAVIERRLGREESKRDKARRKNFCHLTFNTPVPGVKPNSAEVAETKRPASRRESR